MGLDITAYRKLEVAKDAPAYDHWQDDDWDKYIHCYENSDFPGSMAGLDPKAVFKRPENEAQDVLDFRAGSYSGYNWWRDQLCRMVHGISADEYWKRVEAGTAPAAFRELINFSDCEGMIGPVIAAKLARDFAEHQPKADAFTPEGPSAPWWRELYSQWRTAFEMAADNGAVRFH